MTTRLSILAYKPRPERQTIGMERMITSEPLELEYLDTVLQDHDVTLLDGMVDHRDPVHLAGEVRAELVLVTSFITNIHTVLEIAARLRKLPRPPRLFVGGPHAEVMPEHFYGDGVDGVFFADQLQAIAEVARRCAAGEPYDDVGGAAFPHDGEFVRNETAATDMAALPIPRRRLFEAAPHRYYYLYYDRCASVKTAFGCNERCTFCFCTKMHGGRYGARPMDRVMDEIATIETRNIFLLDDNFLTSPARVREFCAGVRERGFHERHEFIAYGGAHFITAHPDVMAELRQAGVTGIIVGFESIFDDELEGWNKSSRASDNDRAVEICQQLDIELFALFIVDPNWTPEQFQALAGYVRSRQLTFATFSTFTVYPGTDAAKQLQVPQPTNPEWWRYDLLRLHQRPRHMSRLRYYLWMMYLYMLPSFTARGRRALRRRYGGWGLIKAGFHSWVVGLEFLIKLLLWR
jgi:hopanoid C-3 methylase